MEKTSIEYFHLVSTEKGDRYFKVDWIKGTCVQVVLNGGKLKKGRPHCLGIYNLALSSFRGSYHWYFGRKQLSGNTNLLQTTENQFGKAFDECINTLKN